MSTHWLPMLAAAPLVFGMALNGGLAEGQDAQRGPAIRAVDFQSRKVYESEQHPSYTSWVSFFPGEHGQWYLTCEEVTRPEKPLPGCTREQWYEMMLPVGYDKSQRRMEIVMLESHDRLRTWHVVSRQPVRFQHSAGSFAQARTKDGHREARTPSTRPRSDQIGRECTAARRIPTIVPRARVLERHSVHWSPAIAMCHVEYGTTPRRAHL